MNLFLDNKDQKSLLKEFTAKGYKEAKFANGGHLFAVSYGSPQQWVYVYNFYTGENHQYHIFRGHSARITGLEWSKDDMHLYTCGADGMLYCWKISDGTSEPVNSKKKGSFNSITRSQDGKTFATVNEKRS